MLVDPLREVVPAAVVEVARVLDELDGLERALGRDVAIDDRVMEIRSARPSTAARAGLEVPVCRWSCAEARLAGGVAGSSTRSR